VAVIAANAARLALDTILRGGERILGKPPVSLTLLTNRSSREPVTRRRSISAQSAEVRSREIRIEKRMSGMGASRP
jgi:hypothetical protein